MLIVQLSDPHIVEHGELLLGGIDTSGFLREAVAHVNRLHPRPQLVLLTGDNTNDGLADQYAHLAEILADLAAPLHLVPGNHDRADLLRAAFPGQVHDRDGRADGVIEGDVRIVTLDSSRYPEPGGDLDAGQLEWLDGALAAAPGAPTIVAVHHPPFATGIGHMDGMALAPQAARELAGVLTRHPQVERLLCGHLHRSITRRFGGTVAMTCPSTAHAVALDLVGGPPAWNHEPPGLLIHRWDPLEGLVTHLELVGDHRAVPFGT